MNKTIQALADQALKECDAANERGIEQYSARLAALIVKACADAADRAYDARCKFPGDYVAEQMGFSEEGVSERRTSL